MCKTKSGGTGRPFPCWSPIVASGSGWQHHANQKSIGTPAKEWQGPNSDPLHATNNWGRKWSSKHTEHTRTDHQAWRDPTQIAKFLSWIAPAQESNGPRFHGFMMLVESSHIRNQTLDGGLMWQ